MPKMSKPTIYLETSVISAYFDFKKQDKSRTIITRRFFKEELSKYQVFISDAVIEELRNTPDKQARQKFLNLAKQFPVIALNKEIISLAQDYIQKKIIPSAKLFDAYHLAVATIHKIDILVSWNYNHIANKFIEEQVNKFNASQKYHEITIKFPLKLLTAK